MNPEQYDKELLCITVYVFIGLGRAYVQFGKM